MRFLYISQCWLAIQVVLTLASLGCGSALGTEAAPPTYASEPGGQISDFILKDINGQSHALSDYLGEKVIVLSFWATWCEPCKKEMSKLQNLYSAHREKGLMVLAISMDEPESVGDVGPFVRQRGFEFPVLLDTESLVTERFNPRRSAPFNLIISREQSIEWSHEGYVPGDEKRLEQAVLHAIGAADP